MLEQGYSERTWASWRSTPRRARPRPRPSRRRRAGHAAAVGSLFRPNARVSNASSTFFPLAVAHRSAPATARGSPRRLGQPRRPVPPGCRCTAHRRRLPTNRAPKPIPSDPEILPQPSPTGPAAGDRRISASPRRPAGPRATLQIFLSFRGPFCKSASPIGKVSCCFL
jgi:hypothetical protein